MVWDAEQSDRHPSRSLGRCIASQRSVQESREWARSARERDADSIARLAEVGGPTWISMHCSRRSWIQARRWTRRLQSGLWSGALPNDKRMEQELTPLPLALLAQRAGAATANAGGIHHAQASISFSAVFVRGSTSGQPGTEACHRAGEPASWPEKRPAFRGG